MSSFYSEEELQSLSIKVGKDCLISRNAQFYGNVIIGDRVRIDDFCVISGNVEIGNNVHIAAYAALFGNYGVLIEDFCSVSGRVSIYTGSDDFLGLAITNPTVPEEFRKVKKGKVVLKKHTILGAGTVVFPGCICEEGTSIGALSLVSQSTEPWTIYSGNPIKRLRKRFKKILEKENEYISTLSENHQHQ